MADHSIDKFVNTITSPYEEVKMNDDVLGRVLAGMKNPDLKSAKISIGPTAVLEYPVADGGGTGMLAELCKRGKKVYFVDRIYDIIDPKLPFKMLERPVRINSSELVLQWCIH